MAQVDIFHDADVTVNVVVGTPPIDQSAQIAALTAQVAQLTAEKAVLQADLDSANSTIAQLTATLASTDALRLAAELKINQIDNIIHA